MLHGRTTLSKFIIEEQRKLAGGAELIALVNDIQTACKYIASAVARCADGRASRSAATRCGAQRAPTRQRPGRGAEAARRHRQRHHAAAAANGAATSRAWCPRRWTRPTRFPPQYPRGRYLLVFDPLDGSSNLDVNVTVGHDLLGAARAGGRHRPEARGFPAAGNAAGLRRLRAVRPGGDDRDHARHRRARLHARPGDRRVHPHAPEPRHRRGHAGVRGQRVEPAVLGAAGASATSRSASPARPARAARTSTCAGSRRWSPRCTGS